jgi:prepilin-type N-terminal cleavage/methylation domain-containing protein
MAPAHTVHRLKFLTGFTLIELMFVILVIGILLAIAVPNFVNARETARAKACVSNLKELDSATEQYAMDNHLDGNTTVTPAQFLALAPTYLRTFPTCPEGGHYAPGATLEENPICSISSGTDALGGMYASGQLWYHGL